MADKNEIESKISSVIDALKDLDTQEIALQLEEKQDISGYSRLIGEIASNPELAIGTEIGKWKIIDLLGKGGMSIVYLVQRNDEQIQQQAALKVIPAGLASQLMVERFVRERQILSDLNHPNIAQLYDAGVTQEGVPWFVMEHIDGEDIVSYARNKQLNIEHRVLLIKQVCEALAYAHAKGIVHRDIKPTNLLVSESKLIKLLDFGIASCDEQQSLTMTGAVIGTPGYMSPEQAKGLGSEIDRRSDVFSVGVLMYKLIKHEMPFQAKSVSEISYKIIHEEPSLFGKHVPIELQAIVFKCLEKNVEKRYSSMNTLAQDLNAYLNGDVISAQKVTFLGRLFKKIKKHRAFSTIIFMAVILSLAGLGYGVYQSIASIKKVQIAEQYLAKAQDIKAKIRRIHMMPLHNIQQEYAEIEREIEILKTEIEQKNSDHTGASYYALASAYYNLRNIPQALVYFRKAEQKDWQSKELSTGIGLSLLAQWRERQEQAKFISNKEEKQQFLERSKQEKYFPALTYLKKAKGGAHNANYLAAKLAFLQEDLVAALEYAKKEIQLNPWHYEALNLSSKIYLQQFRNLGRKEGYDIALNSLELSNQQLDRAIDIGRSDPFNYLDRCTNASIDVQIIKLLEHDEQFPTAFKKGVQACQNAQKLYPESHLSWSKLSLIYVTKAFWLEANEKESQVEYQMALDVAKAGLKLHPQSSELLSYQIKPLLNLANKAIEQGNEPHSYFLQALKAGKKALKLNPKQGKIMFELARAELEYGQYFLRQLKEYDKAEFYFKLALENFKKKQADNPSMANVRNISALEINLYKTMLARNNIAAGIEYLQNSIKRRIEVLPLRPLYFDLFADVITEYLDLIELKHSLNKNSDADTEKTNQLIQQICQIEGLEVEQLQQFNAMIQIVLEKQTGSVEGIVRCKI